MGIFARARKERHAHLENFVFHLDSRHRRLVRQECNLVAQYFGVSGLYQQWRQAGEIAKQGRDVRVRQVRVDRVAEQAFDRV